jgi:uncharacterized membrane protein YtjA (UPF0391 family)
MKPLTKIFLAISIGATLIGFSGIGTSVFWTLAKPVGAIFFVVFFIFYLLEDESEKFAEEERRKHQHYFPEPSPAKLDLGQAPLLPEIQAPARPPVVEKIRSAA